MHTAKDLQTHRRGKQTSGYQWGKGRGEDRTGHKLLSIKWISKEDTYSTRNYSRYLITFN